MRSTLGTIDGVTEDEDRLLDALDFDAPVLCESWACEGSHRADWYLTINCGCVVALCNTVKRIALRDGPDGAAVTRSHERRCNGKKRLQVVRMEPVIKGNWNA